MKVFSKIFMLTLIFVLGFGTVAYGTQTQADEIADLKNQLNQMQNNYNDLLSGNNSLQSTISDLLRQLDEAKENPEVPIPRKPIIVITSPLVIDIEAGKSKTVEFSLENLTGDSAKDVVSTFSFGATTGLSGAFKDRSNNISYMGSKAKKTLIFEITAHENAAEGFQTLTFNHRFLNDANEVATMESIISVRVSNGASGGVSLKDINSSAASIVPGASFDLSAVVHNESNKTMKDVSVTIDGMSSDGIYLRNSTNVVDIASMTAGKKEPVSIGLTTNSKIKKGSYPLTLKLTYNDGSAMAQSKTYTYYVTVDNTVSNENAAEVIITDITYPNSTMGVGQEFSMSVTLKNISEYGAKNVKLSAMPTGDGAIVPKSTSISQIGQLAAGEEKQITFRFAATTSSKSQNYVIGFSVDYETGKEDDTGKNEVNTFIQYQGVNISNPEEDKKEDDEKKTSTPKIIVSSYKSDPIIVKAGQEFDLDMTFLNTSSEKAVKNIKVILSVEEEITSGPERKGSVFTPVDSSNTFYIDRIDPKAEVDEHIRLYTLPDASPKNYIIKVRFEYEDADNNTYEAEESVGINVKQITRLDTSEINIDQWGAMYQPIYVNFEFYNTGKVTLSNLMIKVEGNFEANQSSVYYGSFSPSSTDYYDNQIMPTEAGLQEGAIVITYEDDTGEVIEERKEFSVEVSEPMDMGGDRGMRLEMIMDEKTGEMVPAIWNEKGELVPAMWDENGMLVPAKRLLSTIVKIGIGVVAGFVVIAVAVAVILIKKKKQERIDIDE